MIFKGGGDASPGGAASNVNISQIGGTSQSGANVVDVANTALRVNVVAGAASGYAGQADKSAFTEGTTTIAVNGGEFNTSTTALGSSPQAAAVQVTQWRAYHVNIRNGSGIEQATPASPLIVTGSAGLFPITGSGGQITVLQGTLPWAVTGSGGQFAVVGSGGLFPVTGSGGQIAVVGSGGLFPVTGSGGQIAVVGSGGLFPVTGSGGQMTVLQGTVPWAITGSGGLFPISGSATVYLGSVPVPITGSGGQIAVVGSGGQIAVVGSGGLFPVTGSGGQIAVVGSGGLFPITGSGGVINAIQSGTWTVQPGNTPNTSPWLVTQTPATSGGLLISRTISATSTNNITAKASAGQVFGWVIVNTNASLRYVKLYNKATTVSVGLDTPAITLPIPGNANGAGMVAAEYVNGIAFGTGIGYGTTTGMPDADTGTLGSGDIVLNLFYK